MEMSGPPMDEMGGPMMGAPRDLYELYMTARAELYAVTSFNTLYFKMLFLIDLGKEMLPEQYNGLRRSAEKLLSDAATFPQPSQMEFTGQTYRISTGASSTGLIEVRPEDVNSGRDEIREQKAASLLPRIKAMDSAIFKGLIESGILVIKQPLMEEVLMEDVMAGIREKMVDEEEKMVALMEAKGLSPSDEEPEEERSVEDKIDEIDTRTKEEEYDAEEEDK